MQRWLVFAATLVGAALLGWFAAQPPAPLPVTAPAAVFSAGRAMADVRAIARAPHPTGSAENAHVRAYLVARLQTLGFTVRETRFALSAKARTRLTGWGGPAADRSEGINIIASRPGSSAQAAPVAVMAHYDTVWGSPGAADDSTGVAAALELARALGPGRLPHGLLIILTDGEELGLEGAKAFFAADPLARGIGALVNLESRGGGGRAMMFETGPGNGAMIDLFRRSVTDPSANSLAVKIYELLPNSTDFTPAKTLGIAGFNFAYIGRAALYHSPLATPDAIDKGALQHIGAQSLDVTRALLSGDTLPVRRPDAVFSDVLGRFVIAYPPLIGWTLVAAGAAMLVFAFSRRRIAARDVFAGAGRGLAATAAAAGLLWAINLVSKGTPQNYYDRLAALPRLEVQAALIMMAVVAVSLAGPRIARPPQARWLGLALLNIIMAAAVQALMPAAAPVIVWPLLLALAVLATTERSKPPPLWLAIPAVIVALAQLSGFAHFVLLSVGGDAPFAVAVLMPMFLLLLWPLRPAVAPRAAKACALVLLAAALVLALWVRFDPVAPSVPPYSDKH